MNFLDLKEIKQKLSTLSRLDLSDARAATSFIDHAFEPIIILNFKIVIGTPNSNLSSICQYEEVYVYIEEFFEKSGTIGLLCPDKDNRFCYFNWVKYFKYLNVHQKNSSSYIGVKLTLEDLCQLIKDIYKVSSLRAFF